MSYKGFQVLDIRSCVDVTTPMGLPQESPSDVVRPDGTHPFSRYLLTNYPEHKLTLKCGFDQLATFAAVRDFFLARRGALEAFWLVAPWKDLTPVQDLAGADAAITIRHVGYNELFVSSAGTFRFVLVTNGVEENYRKIDSAADDEVSGDTLTFDSPLTLPATAKEDVSAHFLFFVKFDQNTLSADWDSPDSCLLAVTLKELVGDYPA